MSRLTNAEVCPPSVASSAKRRRLLAGASSAALSLAILLPAGAAFAQAPVTTNAAGGAPPNCPAGSTDPACKAGTELGTVVVTGSRIQRRDYTSNSPIVTLTSQNLIQQSDLEIQDTLNKLPQFSPDQNLIGAQAGDVQPTPTHSVGISTASLRGLGANRNLVLIDGRRGPPVNASLVVDLNTIPTALIDRVETITGGASATYGADAIGGVVNFILQRNFHGVNLDVQYGFNQAGDGRQFSASAVFGTNFADDKGNITFSFERLTSDAVNEENHDFYKKGFANPNVGGTAFTYGTYWAASAFSAGNAQPVPASFFPAGTVTKGLTVSGGAPSQGAVNAIFSNPRDTILGTSTNTLSGLPAAQVSNGSNFYVLGNTVYGIGANSSYTVPYPIDGSEWAYQNCLDTSVNAAFQAREQLGTCVKSNATKTLVQSPLDRWSFFANGHYDFNDWITAEFQGNYARTHTFTILNFPASIIDGWNAFVPYNSVTDDPNSPGYVGLGSPNTGHPVPAQLASLLNSRGAGVNATYCLQGATGCPTTVNNTSTLFPTQNSALVGSIAPYGRNAPWDLSWLPNVDGPLAPRGTDTTNQVFQVTAGLRGKIPGNTDFTKDWTWSAFGTHSESYEYSVATGDYSLQRVRALLTAPGWGQTLGNAFLGGTGNATQPNGSGGTIPATNPGFGVATDTCASGIYGLLFNGTVPSNDCLNAIAAPLQSMNTTKQDQVEFDLQGTAFKLPAGDLKFAVGADYRRDSTTYNPDILQSYDSFLDQVIGVYPVPYSNFVEDVKEGYGELDIPILADLPFIKSFSINPGVRYSTYSASAGGWTYKIMGDYQMNDWLRFRGGYNLAVRAPNIGELFLGKTQNIGAASLYNDPCSLLTKAPFGAGGARTPVNGPGAAVVNSGGAAGAQSAYLICRSMMGAGAASFYDDPNAAAQPAGTPGFLGFLNNEGNANLTPETAHTYTAGVVLRSPLQSDWVRNLTLSVDYYKIHIDHAIEFQTIDYVYQNCLQTTSVTSAAQADAWVASNPFCQGATGVFRNSTGGMGNTTVQEANLGTIDTSGVDLTLDWRIPLSLAWKTLPGQLSLSVNGTFLGNYDTTDSPGAAVKHWYGTLGPTLQGTDPGAYAYRINTSIGYSVGPVNLSLNWRHLPQVHQAIPLGTSTLSLPTSGYDEFDLNGFFNLPHGLQLRAGIQNLFDKAPPTTGSTLPTVASNGQITGLASSGAGVTNPAYYDVNGRRFYIGLKARF